MRGRKPTPTALKIARGNPGKRPLNTREPKPGKILPACPDFLDEEAQRQWRSMTSMLAANGIMTELDVPALTAYRQAWSRWVAAEKNVQRYGAVILSPEKKYPVKSPYLAIANKAMEQMMRILVEFGMTPSSRTRIATGDGAPFADPANDPDSIENFWLQSFDTDPPLIQTHWKPEPTNRA